MKKLLNILTSITLVASGVNTVVACKDTNSPKKKENEIINPLKQIIQDIKDKNIKLPYGRSYSTIQDQQTLFDALKTANPNLTSDLTKYNATLAFVATNTNIPLEKTTPTVTKIEVKVGGETQDININYTVNNKWEAYDITSQNLGTPKYAPIKIGTDYFLITSKGLYSATDLEGTWSQILNIRNITTNIVKLGNNYFFGTQNSGLYESLDNGINWEKNATSGLSSLYITTAPKEINGICFLAGPFNTLSIVSGLWTSDDNGVTWHKNMSLAYALTGVYANVVYINGTYYFSYSYDLYSSNNPTGTWNKVATVPDDDVINANLEFIDGFYYIGTEEGLYYTSNLADSTSWQKIAYFDNKSIRLGPVKIGDYYYVIYLESDNLGFVIARSASLSSGYALYKSNLNAFTKIAKNYWLSSETGLSSYSSLTNTWADNTSLIGYNVTNIAQLNNSNVYVTTAVRNNREYLLFS